MYSVTGAAKPNTTEWREHSAMHCTTNVTYQGQVGAEAALEGPLTLGLCVEEGVLAWLVLLLLEVVAALLYCGK